MFNLLSINNTVLPNIDKGSITVTKNDIYNTYTAEDGHSTIEAVRVGKTVCDVAYKGLLEADVVAIKAAISLVSSVTLYDATAGNQIVFNAKISGLKADKIVYKNNLSAWSLSFRIEEL